MCENALCPVRNVMSVEQPLVGSELHPSSDSMGGKEERE